MNTNKQKYFSIFSGLVCLGLGFVFSIILLLSVIEHYSFSESYFRKQFTKNKISEATGLTNDDLNKVIRQMTGYLSGRESSFNLNLQINNKETPVFNDREIAHMLDVKVIFILLHKIKNLSLLVLAIFFVPYSLLTYFRCRRHRNARTMVLRRHYWMNIYKTIAFNGLFTLLFIGALGFMIFSDFSKYFIKFHEVFFDNDLWLLNPQTDRLIQMLPEVFFFDISFRMVTSYALISLGISVIGIILFFILRKDDISI